MHEGAKRMVMADRKATSTSGRNSPSESRILSQILANLHARHFFCWRANTGVARTQSGVVRFGIPGAADIQGIVGDGAHRGRFFGIEVKAEHGQLSPQQVSWGQRVVRAGGIYIVAKSWPEVEAALESVIP